MTTLAVPIWFLREDVEKFRALADATSDTDGKSLFQDRAEQCELAAKILELYVQHTTPEPADIRSGP
jgi:hypothetical protein